MGQAMFAAVSAGVALKQPQQQQQQQQQQHVWCCCWVLTSQEHDRLRKGFSFSFASNMRL
jgi:hypothetical protein